MFPSPDVHRAKSSTVSLFVLEMIISYKHKIQRRRGLFELLLYDERKTQQKKKTARTPKQ
jgi:hypothetical protein